MARFRHKFGRSIRPSVWSLRISAELTTQTGNSLTRKPEISYHANRKSLTDSVVVSVVRHVPDFSKTLCIRGERAGGQHPREGRSRRRSPPRGSARLGGALPLPSCGDVRAVKRGHRQPGGQGCPGSPRSCGPGCRIPPGNLLEFLRSALRCVFQSNWPLIPVITGHPV